MKKIYFLLPLIGISLLSAQTSNAQMVSGSVFLKGHYVEVGIGALGYYGSDTTAPAGYHPHLIGGVPANRVGFVADPLMTGWDTAAAHHYMGDYFLPGSPFEGWDIQIGGKRCEAYNNGPTAISFMYGGGMGTCFGYNTGYATSGSTVSATWQGTADSVTITQVTTLDTMDFYFTVKVTLTNTAVAPKNDIYYFRSLDPDNDETWTGGGFPTNNTIDLQMPAATASMVTAVGMSSTLPPLSLGSPDTASRAVIYNSWPITSTTDLATVYNETWGGGTGAFYTAGVNHPGDIAIGLIMNVPHLATVDSAGDSVLRTTSSGMLHPANTASFTYFYAFSTAGADSAIARLNRGYSGTGTLSTGIHQVNTDINVYPNPAKNLVNITGLNTTDHVSVYNMMGQTVINNQQATTQGLNTISLNNLPAGAYVLIVTDENGAIRSRVPVRKM